MFALITVGVLLTAMVVGVMPFILHKSEEATLKWLTAALWITLGAATLNVVGVVFLVR